MTYSLEVRLPPGLKGEDMALYGRNQGGAVDWFVVNAQGDEVLDG